MAERRMFAKTIVLSDAFLDMPLSARCLYFTLGMLADDDGFINNPKSIIRQCGASNDDMKILIAKKFIIPFESGVIVIKHWRINNYLQKDRYKSTIYQDEKAQITVDDSGNYHADEVMYTDSVYTQDSIGKDSIGNNNIYSSNSGEFEAPFEGESASKSTSNTQNATSNVQKTTSNEQKSTSNEAQCDVYEALFRTFWKAYPKKQDKKKAHSLFIKLKPDEELLQAMLTSLEQFKKSEQWTREKGIYIPMPSTWLFRRRWEDELEVEREKTAYERLMEEMQK